MGNLEDWAKLVRELDPKIFADADLRDQTFKKIESGKISRDEDKLRHFIVYFLPYNPLTKKVYLVYVEKVEGLWLFPGGHVDKGESAEEALIRETGEELGIDISSPSFKSPFLVSHTLCRNTKKPCVDHFDFWYLVETDGRGFKICEDEDEFSQPRWIDIESAKPLVTDLSTRLALERLSLLGL